jgi:hypothetical protein
MRYLCKFLFVFRISLIICIPFYLFIFGLISDVSVSNYIVSNGKVIADNEVERLWKEVVVAEFEVISHKLPGGIEEIHNNTQPY